MARHRAGRLGAKPFESGAAPYEDRYWEPRIEQDLKKGSRQSPSAKRAQRRLVGLSQDTAQEEAIESLETSRAFWWLVKGATSRR
jgi:hypothetical protein